MNKSLLRILKTEGDILNDIACCEDRIAMYAELLRECEDSEYFRNRVAIKKAELAELQGKLESTRSEMRDYFAMLFGKANV